MIHPPADWWPDVKDALLLHAPMAVSEVREHLCAVGYRIAPPSPASLQVLEAAGNVENGSCGDTLPSPPDTLDRLNSIASGR